MGSRVLVVCFVLVRLCTVAVVAGLVGALLPVGLALLVGPVCLTRGDSLLVVFEDLLALDQGLQKLVDLFILGLFFLFLTLCSWGLGAQGFELLSDHLDWRASCFLRT